MKAGLECIVSPRRREQTTSWMTSFCVAKSVSVKCLTPSIKGGPMFSQPSLAYVLGGIADPPLPTLCAGRYSAHCVEHNPTRLDICTQGKVLTAPMNKVGPCVCVHLCLLLRESEWVFCSDCINLPSCSAGYQFLRDGGC